MNALGFGGVEEGLGLAGFDDLALVEEDDTVGDFFGEAHFVGIHDEGHAGVGEGFYGIEDFLDHFGVEG